LNSKIARLPLRKRYRRELRSQTTSKPNPCVENKCEKHGRVSLKRQEARRLYRDEQLHGLR
jgi:hypothetical protein